MNPVIEKINSFADLLENWDSYGAAEIADAAMRKAVAVVEYLDDMALDEHITVNAFPVCTGMVQLDVDFAGTGRGVEIACDANGAATVTYIDKDGEVVEGRHGVHCDTIERFLLGK